MSEKYRFQIAGDGVMFAAINTETERAVGFGGEDLMKNLCAKLNRLAALDAVCREIMESAPVLGSAEYIHSEGTVLETYIIDDIVPKLKAVFKEQS